MDKHAILGGINFGRRVAEDEIVELASYFVETDQWRRTYDGEIDIIYGPKGSGKSAIYSLLLARSRELRERGVLVVPGENLRGTPAFKDLVVDPPASQREFIGLWKLYLLSLVGRVLKDESIHGAEADRVVTELERIGLLERSSSLASTIRSALTYVRSMMRAESMEGGVSVDPGTGLPTLSGRITFREPTAADNKAGFVSVDALLGLANAGLEKSRRAVWLLLDRLDVAFADTVQLEQNALGALFRVYLDSLAFDFIRLKIFLRTDIWRRVSQEGFREASHIERTMTISWDERSLLNLIVRRLVKNPIIGEAYDVQPEQLLRVAEQQEALFYRIFPRSIQEHGQELSALTWMITNTSDASQTAAPREIIHLLNDGREAQLRSLELGEAWPGDECLIGAQALITALQGVSKVRLEQTLYAEYPELRELIRRLEGKPNRFVRQDLQQYWDRKVGPTGTLIARLQDVGFFSASAVERILIVPPIYAIALRIGAKRTRKHRSKKARRPNAQTITCAACGKTFEWQRPDTNVPPPSQCKKCRRKQRRQEEEKARAASAPTSAPDASPSQPDG